MRFVAVCGGVHFQVTPQRLIGGARLRPLDRAPGTLGGGTFGSKVLRGKEMKPDSWQSGFANLTVSRESWRLPGWVNLGLSLL